MESLDELISRTFSISRSESRRIIALDGVKNANNEPVKDVDDVSDGDELKIGRNRVKTVRKEVK